MIHDDTVAFSILHDKPLIVDKVVKQLFWPRRDPWSGMRVLLLFLLLKPLRLCLVLLLGHGHFICLLIFQLLLDVVICSKVLKIKAGLIIY